MGKIEMTLHLPEDTQATLLLCGRFGAQSSKSYEPLALSEYNLLASWLKDHDLRPADLLSLDTTPMREDPPPEKLNLERIEALLNRGASMALAIESWTNKGLWLVGRSDESYPQRLKMKLKLNAPPLFYGAGNQELLSKGGLAIIGSRDVDEEGLYFANRVAVLCAKQSIQVISGGARGVDREAMTAALDEGGEVVGVLANSLMTVARSKRYRDAISDRRLVLISAYHPESGFNVGNAMARNKHIYALSNWALVINSTLNKGGTWAGATENLRHKWASLYVKAGAQVPDGNQALIDKGGFPMEAKDVLDGDVALEKWFGSKDFEQDEEKPQQLPLM